VKTISKYKADDGSEFNTETECLKHEALCTEISAAVAALPKSPTDSKCQFANGGGYIQHTAGTFYHVREQLLRIANRLMPHKWFDESIAHQTVDASWAGRLIDEISDPLRRAWFRIMCTDKTLREWGQPYYAMHPDKGEQIETTEPTP
jgi:hypothetical protein